MHPVAKPILIALGALATLVAAPILGLNLYLQSPDVQRRIAQVLPVSSAAPSIGHTYYTPWSGLVVSKIKLPPQPGSNRPMLEILTVKLRIGIGDLFGGRLVVENIDIIHPVLVLARQPDGAWIEKKSPTAPASVPANLPPPAPSADQPAIAAAKGETESAEPARQQPETQLEAFQIRNGTAIFYTHAGLPSLKAEGIDVESAPAADGGIAGTFRIQKAAIHGAIQPTEIKGTFTWKYGRLEIPGFEGAWAGGRIAGAFELLPSPIFRASLSAQDVSLRQFASDSGLDPGATDGSFRASLSMQGVPAQPETFTGSGEAVLSEARIEPVDFIRQLGELLRIDELRLLELGTAEAAFSIRGGQVVVDRLVTVTENLMMDATGTVDFDGTLDLDARFHVNEKLRRETRGLVGSNFKSSEIQGYTHMPFKIGGTTAKPTTDLLDKVVGARIGQDLGGFLKNLFRMPQNKKTKAPTPTASPAN